MALQSINPATGERIGSFPGATPVEVSRALAAASDAFGVWSRAPHDERARLMRRAARSLRESKERWARLMAEEMGKPMTQGKAEAEKSAWACEYFADNADRFLALLEIPTEARKSYVTFQPLGVVLGIMPWNFPFWQVFRAAAPALMAGNTFVLKHASNVCGCSIAIAEIFHEAGFPPGVFTSLLLDSRRVGSLIADQRIRAVTLTGSTTAGRSVASAAGENLKKVVLELGGSDPYLVLEDADLEAAARSCAEGKLINTGQSCIAAKRMIVVRSVMRQFEELLVREMGARETADPRKDSTQLGPLARADLRETVASQVERSIQAGARCVMGGQVPEGPGFFYPPTVLTDVHPGMPAFDEEVFAPVAAVVAADNEGDAIRLANASSYGLGAVVYTRDLARGERIAREELQAGSCFVNAYVRSDPRLPFGGIKESGLGRELSAFGIREFVNVKTVWVQ
ncbi:MAG TPA: NAD-dependent succinate-semialdehyde dehydrogenase [Spirochaetia bacterium]|nr:NAD-dependent succinate-semialdehyde dehydrogenase [Spirochaetia bacterium]